MTQLKLTKQEKEILAETLKSYLSNLSYEIADTDNHDYRDKLKAKRAVLEKIKASLDKA